MIRPMPNSDKNKVQDHLSNSSLLGSLLISPKINTIAHMPHYSLDISSPDSSSRHLVVAGPLPKIVFFFFFVLRSDYWNSRRFLSAFLRSSTHSLDSLKSPPPPTTKYCYQVARDLDRILFLEVHVTIAS